MPWYIWIAYNREVFNRSIQWELRIYTCVYVFVCVYSEIQIELAVLYLSLLKLASLVSRDKITLVSSTISSPIVHVLPVGHGVCGLSRKGPPS